MYSYHPSWFTQLKVVHTYQKNSQESYHSDGLAKHLSQGHTKKMASVGGKEHNPAIKSYNLTSDMLVKAYSKPRVYYQSIWL